MTAGGGHGPGHYQPATIALGNAADPGQDTVALAFTGTLDGKPVAGSVTWHRDDDSIHALVLHRDANDDLQLQAVNQVGRAEVTLDIDGDGEDDVIIGLDGESIPDAEHMDQERAGVIPALTIMLRAAP